RLLRVVENEAAIAEVRAHLESLLKEARIAGITKVVVSNNPSSAIQSNSRDAAFVFLGMQPPVEGEEGLFFHRTEALIGKLERVALVQSAGGMRLES
ncbi:MAG: amino acid permease, partial [Pirellulaceae bacterium]|nr:amino acid permease [Pirellulaceae bacterium]